MFTNSDDRPTYKFMPAELTGEQLVHMEYFAVPGARRRDLHVQGVAHTNPIPMAVQIGRYVFSSRRTTVGQSVCNITFFGTGNLRCQSEVYALLT